MIANSLQMLDQAMADWIEAIAALQADVLRVIAGGEQQPVARGELESAVDNARHACEVAADLHCAAAQAAFSVAAEGVGSAYVPRLGPGRE